MITSRTYLKINIGLILAVLALIIGLFAYPIDVIKDEDWKLTVEGGNTHYVGETIAVSSVYTKLRKADGVANRYIECKTKYGVFQRYDLSIAKANRLPAEKKTGTGFDFVPPIVITPIPTRCKVAVGLSYPVLKIGDIVIRSVPEYKESNEFDLLPTVNQGDPTGQTEVPGATSSTSSTIRRTDSTGGQQITNTTNNNTTNNTVNNQTKPPKDRTVLQAIGDFTGGLLNTIGL